MTREEAIKELNTFKKLAKSESGEKALDMAIEAFEEILKLIDNSDLISREKIRKTIVDGTKFDTRQDYVRVLDAIESVPSYTSYN